MQRALSYEEPLAVSQWGKGREELCFLGRAMGTGAPLQEGKCQEPPTGPLGLQPGYLGCVLGARFAPKVHAVHTYSTQGECVWNVSITSKIMFNMFQTYCIKQIAKQYLKHILFFILIDCKCIKHMLRIYFIYCICKILSNLYRRKPQSHHRIGPRAIPFFKLTF